MSEFSLGIGDEESLTPLLKDEDFVIEEDGVLKQGTAQITQDMETYLSLESLRDRIQAHQGVNISVALECLQLDRTLAIPNYLEYSNKLSDKHYSVTLESLSASAESFKEKAKEGIRKLIEYIKRGFAWLTEQYKKMGVQANKLKAVTLTRVKRVKQAPSKEIGNPIPYTIVRSLTVSGPKGEISPFSIQSVVQSQTRSLDFAQDSLALVSAILEKFTNSLASSKDGASLSSKNEEDKKFVMTKVLEFLKKYGVSNLKDNVLYGNKVPIYGFLDGLYFNVGATYSGALTNVTSQSVISEKDKLAEVRIKKEDLDPLEGILNATFSRWEGLSRTSIDLMSKLTALTNRLSTTFENAFSGEYAKNFDASWYSDALATLRALISLLQLALKQPVTGADYIGGLFAFVDKELAN